MDNIVGINPWKDKVRLYVAKLMSAGPLKQSKMKFEEKSHFLNLQVDC